MTRTGVCQVVSTFRPLVGGVQRVTESVSRELLRQGVDAVVLTRRFPGLAGVEQANGLEVRRLGLPLTGRLGSLSFALHALWALAREYPGHAIVHVQNIDTPFLVGLLAKRLLGRRLVLTVHGEEKVFAKRRSRLGRLRLRGLRRVDAFGALTAAMRDALVAEGVHPGRIWQLPNGVDTARIRPATPEERRAARARFGIPPGDRVILYLGRLVPGKRVDRLLHAWAALPPGAPATLLVVGDGPERGPLERLADALGAGRVRFEGATDEVLPYLHAADVLALTSEAEGSPMAVAEGMAAGLAVVATALPGVAELVRDGESGLLVPGDDPDALAAALRACLEGEARLREMGRTGRATIEQRMALPHTVALHRVMYRAIEQGSAPMRPRGPRVGIVRPRARNAEPPGPVTRSGG